MFSGPPSEYWPIVPSERTTRWHGHDERHGVVAEGRADRADGLRAADLGGDPAVRPDLAARDLEGLVPDVAFEVGVAAQVEVDPDPTVAVEPPRDRGREPVRHGSTRMCRAPGPGQVVRLERSRRRLPPRRPRRPARSRRRRAARSASRSGRSGRPGRRRPARSGRGWREPARGGRPGPTPVVRSSVVMRSSPRARAAGRLRTQYATTRGRDGPAP